MPAFLSRGVLCVRNGFPAEGEGRSPDLEQNVNLDEFVAELYFMLVQNAKNISRKTDNYMQIADEYMKTGKRNKGIIYA